MGKEFIIRNVTGQFLGYGRQWVNEYPDAMQWDSAQKARRAAAGVKTLCEIVEDYGLDSEAVVDTVG